MNVLDVLNSPWAIVPEKYAQIRDIYERHAQGESIDIAAAQDRMDRLEARRNSYRSLEVDNGVGVLSISGVLAKRMNLFADISGGTSTQLLQRDFRNAMQDPEVHSILLLIDSPGGEVSGTQEFANQIFEARGQKPIVAICEGMMASAAYWIGSSADEMYVSSGTDQVGSIGVVAAHTDISKAEEHRGIKVTEISAGKYKRIASEHAPLSAEGRAELQDMVDQTYTVFVNDVARNRGISSEKVLSDMAEGRVFIGQRAVDVGLVDGQRTALQAVQQLKADRQKLLFPTRSASALTPGGSTMTTTAAVPGAAPTASDIEAMRKQCHDDGYKAGAEAERARIQSVEAQSMPGHEALIATLKFDGKTTGEQAAVQVLGAERKKLAAVGADLRADAPTPVPNTPTEQTTRTTQTVNSEMSAEQVEAVAKDEWAKDPKLSRQFTGIAAYVALRKAEARGLVRVMSKKPA